MKQYVMIYSINAFCKSTKTSQMKVLLYIAFSILTIRLITACAGEIFFEIQIVFHIESFGHSKIPLVFYA